MIDILFSRHYTEDFSTVKSSLEALAKDKNIILMIEGNTIYAEPRIFLSRNYPSYLELYNKDLQGKYLIENSSPQGLSDILSEIRNKGFAKDSMVYELYNLAYQKKWNIKHEITPPDLLFALQLNYLFRDNLHRMSTEGPDAKYLKTMRAVLIKERDLTYRRDTMFLNQMSFIDSEDVQILSTRGGVHNYMTHFNTSEINFHGKKDLCTDNSMIKVIHKFLLKQRVTDQELIEIYNEAKKSETD